MSTGHYDVPNWAGKPPPGFHLDVYKEGKLFQKLMIDEKKCYHFGRNPSLNDVCIDHQSCSRVHAALVYHRHLERCFLVDLGSSHGTFIGNLKLEPHRPTQLPIDSKFRFGASTRYYVLREKPTTSTGSGDGNSEAAEIGPLLLPESEIELDSLTEFNTAHNKRVSMMGIREEDAKPRRKSVVLVKFKEEDEIINPEDVDPSIGRFRNLVQTTIIPTKRPRIESGTSESGNNEIKSTFGSSSLSLSDSGSTLVSPLQPIISSSLSMKLNINLPNPAPEVNLDADPTSSNISPGSSKTSENAESDSPSQPKKKRYAKESWPGRRPVV